MLSYYEQSLRQVTRHCSTATPNPTSAGSKVPYIIAGTAACAIGGIAYYWNDLQPHLPWLAHEKVKLAPVESGKTNTHSAVVGVGALHTKSLERTNPATTSVHLQDNEELAITKSQIKEPVKEQPTEKGEPEYSTQMGSESPSTPDAVVVATKEKEDQINATSPILLEAVKTLSKESASGLVSELQQDVSEQLSKVNTAIMHNEEKIGSIQSHIAALAGQFEQATIDNQLSRDHEKQAFQEVLLVQENAFRVRLEKALQEERANFQQSLENHLKEAEQQYHINAQHKVCCVVLWFCEKCVNFIQLEEEKVNLQQQYEALYREQYTDLRHKFNSDLSKALADFESTLLFREQEVLTHYKQRHTEQLQTLHKYNNELVSANTALAENVKHQAQSEKTHSICIALFGLGNALVSPTQASFTKELAALRVAAQGDPIVETLAKPLEQISNTGVSSYSQLMDRFKAVAQSGRQAALVPEEGGIVGNIVAAVASRLIIPEKGLVEGDEPEALFAKAEYYLNKGDLGAAVSHLEKLRGMPATIARDWVVAANEKLAAERSLNALQAYVASLSAGDKAK